MDHVIKYSVVTEGEEAARLDLLAQGFTNAEIVAAKEMAGEIDPPQPNPLLDTLMRNIELVRPHIQPIFDENPGLAWRIQKS